MSDNLPQPTKAISASEQSEPQRPPSVLSERYGVPWTIIGTIVGIVAGFVVAFFFFKLSEQRKQFAYTNPVTSIRIFDSKSASPAIRVLDSQSQPITEDVYVAEVVFWNSGNVPIEPSDVRGEPIKLILSPVVRIIDLRVTGTTHDNVGKFVVSEANLPDGSGNNRKAVQVQWEHLDPEFGVRFQVTYTGLPTGESGLELDVQGNIVSTEEVSVDRTNRASQGISIPRLVRFGVTVFLCMTILLIFLRVIEKFKWFPDSSRRVIRSLSLVLMMIIAQLLAVFDIWVIFFPQPQPPF
jgi:hypothetical protein